MDATFSATQTGTKKKLFLFSLIMLTFGSMGYFTFGDHWMRYFFAHLGALGVIGLFSCLAGSIAARKGFSYKRAVLSGFFSPIILGIIAAYLIDPPKKEWVPSVCGGAVSLGVALMVVIIYFALKERKT